MGKKKKKKNFCLWRNKELRVLTTINMERELMARALPDTDDDYNNARLLSCPHSRIQSRPRPSTSVWKLCDKGMEEKMHLVYFH